VSDLRIEPGKRLDTQFIVNYDPQSNRLTAIGTLMKLKPYKESFVTLADFSVLNLPLNPPVPPANFEQRSNQIRVLGGYGDTNRHGWSVGVGASYDFTQATFQNQLVEVATTARAAASALNTGDFRSARSAMKISTAS